MATRVTAATVLPVLSVLILLRTGTCADDYSAFVYAGCSQGRYSADSQYASGVDSVLTSVANSAPYAPYDNFTAPTDSSVVGLYQCRSDLPASVCSGCVRSAISRLSSLCAWAVGGTVQLRACFVRYGNDSFLGKQDTAVLFKKCGGTPGDAGGVAMRDSALGALVAGGSGGRRVPRRRVRRRAGHVAVRGGPRRQVLLRLRLGRGRTAQGRVRLRHGRRGLPRQMLRVLLGQRQRRFQQQRRSAWI